MLLKHLTVPSSGQILYINTAKTVLKTENNYLCLSCKDSQSQGNSLGKWKEGMMMKVFWLTALFYLFSNNVWL